MSSQAFELFPRQLPVPPPPTAEDIAFDNAPRILAITGTFFTAALIVVMLRIYVRTVLLRVIGIDDYVMLGAMVSPAASLVYSP